MDNLAYKQERSREILNGIPIMMSPSPIPNHNRVIGNIFYSFKNYLRGKICVPFSDGVDVHLTEKDLVIPDVMIVCNREIIGQDGVYGAPDLVVEVLSPSTAKYDKGYKKDLYQDCGVKEYWIVEIESRSVDAYLLKDGVYVLNEVYAILPDYVLNKMTEEELAEVKMEIKTSLFEEFVLPIEEIFDDLL